jgi:hypothetical protein
MLESLRTTSHSQSGMTPAFRLTLIWIAGCLLAFVTAMNFLPASLVDGHYIPVGNDSFYHARRILDTVANPSGFYEFDPYIHYPQGSWITWPWGYDYLMAEIVRAAIWLLGPRDPMAVLAYIPVYAITITMALVLAIASVLRLSMTMRALVIMIFGISPLTQTLHGVGMVDHHFAEHICILASILLAVLWLRAPQNRAFAAALGVALGVSVTIHNGLFILQLPLLGALLLMWFKREPIERRGAAWFGAALFASTLAAALPAEALQRGFFEFYLLSWFHVYVAGCTAVVAILLSRWSFSRRNLVWLSAVALILLAPLVAQAILGGTFISGKMEALQGIDEVQSPVKLAFSLEGAERISKLYGLLVWLSPLWLAVSILQVVREKRVEFRYFWIVATFTILLMAFQLRFFYYGSLALYIVPFWCLDQLRERSPQHSKLVLALSCVVAAIAVVPPMKSILFERPVPSLDPIYSNGRELYPVLARACKQAPGVALGSPDEGHYIRFHTQCSVIANNFRMTEQHAERLRYLEHLYTLKAAQLVAEAPEVRYVMVHVIGPYTRQPDGTDKPTPDDVLRGVNYPLNADLLMTPVDQLPPRIRRLHVVTLPNLPHPIAGLFEILPPQSVGLGKADGN